MNYPSIIKFIGYSEKNFEQEPKYAIISEYCQNGTLMSFILEPDKYTDIWTDTKKLITIFGVASGMNYLHSHNILHRDLKPENILMDDHLFPKIADFGFSKQIHFNEDSMTLQSSIGFKGTPIYTAPEVFRTNKHSKKSDVYSFGIILYEIMTSKIPFINLGLLFISKIADGYRPPFENPINSSYRNLIERCWSDKPDERPTFDQIVNELKNNVEFITKNVNEEEFRCYVKFIEEYQSSFDNRQIIIDANEYIHPINDIFQIINIRKYTENTQKTFFSSLLSAFGLKQEKLYPKENFNMLDEQCKLRVVEAENDPEKQYYIGTFLIEGKGNFPKNVDLGIKYLDESISRGNIDSTLYLSRILIEGNIVQRDLPRAKKYLSKFVRTNEKAFILYGIIVKIENNLSDLRKYYQIGVDFNDKNMMYKYGKMLFYGDGGSRNVKKALEYFNMSANNGSIKSKIFLKAIDKTNSDQSFSNLPTKIQYFFIKQIVKYIISIYPNYDDSNEIITNKEIVMKDKWTDILFFYNSFKSLIFIQILKSFQSISVEIIYPSKIFEEELTQISKIFTMGVIIKISNTDSMSQIFGTDRIIIKVNISSTVISIIDSAFRQCSSLSQISIPSSVTSIGDYCFDKCSSLKKISIPSSVVSIGSYVFKECSSLTKISIPSSVTSIGNYCFDICSSLKEISISSSVVSIGSYAFKGCSSLTKISIPSSVTSIGSFAFSECSSLFQISLSSSLKSIRSYTFDRCTSLDQITIPSSVTSIEQNAFYLCSSLSKILIPSSVTSIKDSIFFNCSRLKEVSLPSSISIIENSMFYGCSFLSEIVIPSSITSIESIAFYGCSSLKQITIPPSVKIISTGTFEKCSSLTEISIPSSVTLICSDAFKECSALTKITIPSSVLTIGSHAFKKCKLLSQIVLLSTEMIIEYGAFYGCSSLKQISNVPFLPLIEYETFQKCSSLTEILIPTSVTSIGSNAFEGCSSLAKIQIPSSVISIESGAFNGCSSLTKITIPSSVTSIGSNAFEGCSSLTDFQIPSSVISIGKSAFKKCVSLKKIPIFAFMRVIKSNTFEGCSSLEEISIPSSVTSINYCAFKSCTHMKQINIPSSLKRIENFAFCRCSSLKQISFPSSVEFVGEYSFYKCSSLEQVTFPFVNIINDATF